MIQIKEGHIVIPMPASNEYNIPLTECKSYESILGWVIKISEKSWVTREIIEEFIKTALKQNKLNRPLT